MSSTDIIIVGGGPAGLTTAFLLRNKTVYVFEEHKELGIPKHCTGLVGLYTASFFNKIAGKNVLDNKYNSICYHIPCRSFCLYWNRPIAYRIKRPYLEQKLGDLIESIGHKLFLGKRIKTISVGKNRVEDNKGKTYSYGKLVIAEGAKGFLTKNIRGKNSWRNIIGIQRRVRIKNIEPYTFHVFFPKILRDFFAWLVPIDYEEALIGYGLRIGQYINYDLIQCYVEKRTGLKTGSGIEVFGGLIPISRPGAGVIENIYFIGDSLPFTKPFTGGGLYGIALLAPYLAIELEQNIPIFKKSLQQYRSRLNLQFIARDLSIKISGTWVVPALLELLTRFGISIKQEDYDRHENIVLKALPILLTQPWLLPYILYSRDTCVKPLHSIHAYSFSAYQL